MAHITDIMATILDAAGIKYPETYNGNTLIPLEEESFIPLIQGNTWNRKASVCIEHLGNCAVYHDKYKLVRGFNFE